MNFSDPSKQVLLYFGNVIVTPLSTQNIVHKSLLHTVLLKSLYFRQLAPKKGGFEWTTEARDVMCKLLQDKNGVQVKINKVPGCPLAFVDLHVSDTPFSTTVSVGKTLKLSSVEMVDHEMENDC